MKLCAIYIVWDDFELLINSVYNLHCVDGLIVVQSEKSNLGESSGIIGPIKSGTLVNFEPDLSLTPRENETAKRNLGIKTALAEGYTHFLMLDADEFYLKEDIELGRRMIGDNKGLVCKSIIYFRTPEISIEDHTLVPFIHKLTPELTFGRNHNYPYSIWNERLSIDPTRQLNITEGINYAPITMHHMSGIRKDIRKKIRNSSGEKMKQFGNLWMDDYKNAVPGYKSKYYGRVMHGAENIFNLPEMIDTTI